MTYTRSQIVSALTLLLGSRPEVLFAYVFGSITESHSYRDVDVALYVRDLSHIPDPLQYTITLGLEVERQIRCGVDVVLMNTAPDHLIHSISKGEVIVNRDDDARVDFITSSWSRYFDIQGKRRQAIVDMVS